MIIASFFMFGIVVCLNDGFSSSMFQLLNLNRLQIELFVFSLFFVHFWSAIFYSFSFCLFDCCFLCWEVFN